MNGKQRGKRDVTCTCRYAKLISFISGARTVLVFLVLEDKHSKWSFVSAWLVIQW